MEYTLRELECFTAVAEELSFTRAARRLHLAQPPLSRHIRALEERIGARLFERGPRAVRITPAGAVFHEETRGVLPRLLRAAEAARRTALGETTRLRLGFVSAVLSVELVETLRRFREENPGVRVMLHDMAPAEQMEGISRGTLDGGFAGLMPRERPPGVRFTPWRREPVAAFVPSGHRLAGRRRISIEELAGEPFAAVSAAAAPAFSAFVRELCREADFRPRVILESPRAQAVAVMVAAGPCVALLPESLAQVTGGAAAALRLKGGPHITHVFARAAGATAPSVELFLRLLSHKVSVKSGAHDWRWQSSPCLS